MPYVPSAFGEDAFGRRAEAAAHFFDTPKHIAGQTIAVTAWIAVNALAVSFRWDPYHYPIGLAFHVGEGALEQVFGGAMQVAKVDPERGVRTERAAPVGVALDAATHVAEHPRVHGPWWLGHEWVSDRGSPRRSTSASTTASLCSLSWAA
jgi:hypothetical protein